MTRYLALLFCATLSLRAVGQEKIETPKPAPLPVYRPAAAPTATGEVPIGVIVITFKETAVYGSLSGAMESMGRINGITLEEYFKTYSNGIVWPKLSPMPNSDTIYQAPQFYGYYCEFDYWGNPMGWRTREEGDNRANQLKKEAMEFAMKGYRGTKPRYICYNYVTKRPETPSKEVTDELSKAYLSRGNAPVGHQRAARPANNRKGSPAPAALGYDPWTYYAPVCRWGDPMWPDSIMQINDFAGATLAHEFGHALGAPDVYHVGRSSDGISGEASLLAYGPTANAFSRFYHHGFIKAKNHPVINAPGTYTLSPRHITPKADEAVGYLIPSNHPHYLYHVEYINGEDDKVGVGPSTHGVLISVVNLGRTSYLGSPDYFYVYRPNDPFFRGTGDTGNCLFGPSHGRTEFNMNTEPSSRLPNLLDGGVSIKNIQEKNGTASFEVVINRKPVTGSAYTESMLPQIRLDDISDIQSTSCAFNCTIKFRGEPIKTEYGFCWSTRSKPTVSDATFTLSNRECYRGHALHLLPNTTYYVRAFATNGIGIRYSDEEKTFRTLATAAQRPNGIGPLCLDSFSNNNYLHRKFSREDTSFGEDFIGYSTVCVLGKLIGYYRPENFTVAAPPAPAGQRPARDLPINFNHLNWDPQEDSFKMRLKEVDRFFHHLLTSWRPAGWGNIKPDKDLVKTLAQISGFKNRPVLTPWSDGSSTQVVGLITSDLRESRPVILCVDHMSRWALIDGINAKGEFHVDFPSQLDKDEDPPRTGYYSPETLTQRFKDAVVISSFGN